ncbi:unnamed protein product [Durusdinium trenchii]|uniref:Uncharacterized protein n=1 Tax=Durusdinium trenchii TaxID=1381693 RepID=A0ABP0N386_9DINO
MDRQGGRSRPSGVGTVFDGSLDWEAWCQVRPEESDILEVTGLAGLEGCDASKGVFWVQSIADVDALGLKLQVAFLGGSEGTTGPTLAQIFNRRKSVLHLCHGELPCSVDGCGGHATRFTRYKVYDYDVSYLHQEVAKAFKRRKREWDKLRGKGHSGDALSGGDDGSGRPRGDGLRAPVAGDHLDADPEEPRGEPLFPETGAGGTWGELKPPVELDRGAQFPVATDERRSALRKTLSEAKQRFHDAQGRGRQSRARPGGEPFSVFDSVPEGMPPPPTTKRDFKTNKKDSAEAVAKLLSIFWKAREPRAPLRRFGFSIDGHGFPHLLQVVKVMGGLMRIGLPSNQRDLAYFGCVKARGTAVMWCCVLGGEKVFSLQLANGYEEASDVMMGKKINEWEAFGQASMSSTAASTWYERLPNVIVLDPSMTLDVLQAKIWAVQNATTHFGTERYAILLKPGDYPPQLLINLGYYTSIIGVGANPDDVKIPDLWVSNDITGQATNNFWRSVEGVTVTGPRTMWAVSQASPLRRSIISGELWLSHEEGYSSGGFISDVQIGKKLVMGTQQQWFFRQITFPTEGLWCWQGWNYVFMGALGLDDASVQKCNTGMPHKISQMDRTARSAEKPYLVLEDDGRWMMYIPGIVHQPAPGALLDHNPAYKLTMDQVFVADPEMSTETIVQGLRTKEACLLTPGIYYLTEPLEITKDRFVLLGIGFPTLVSPPGMSCIKVQQGLNDVRVASIIMDANTPASHDYTEPLLQWGDGTSHWSQVAGVASDIVARVGAFGYLNCELKRADTLVEFNADDLIVDNVWVWHADHDDCSDFTMAKGADMMDYKFQSDQCQSTHGIVVNGNNLVAYGVFVEHIVDGHMLLWNGEAGQLYFFQAELPYHSEKTLPERYAAYVVAQTVYSHFAVGLGAYIIDREPAYAGFQVSPYADLRNVVTVIIDAPEDTMKHQVCQESEEGQKCFAPQNCSWSRCWRASLPIIDAHAMTLRGAAWPQVPPTEKLPAPEIVKRLSGQETYRQGDWNYADFSMSRDAKRATRQFADRQRLRAQVVNWESHAPWLGLCFLVALPFLLTCWANREPVQVVRPPEAEAEIMLEG